MTLHIMFYQDNVHEWRWRAVAGNNEVVADSAEGYVHKNDCVDMAHQLFDGGAQVTYVGE